jgi:transketolase
LRCINNIDIIAPSDNFETQEAVKALIDYSHPAYIRFGKQAVRHLYNPEKTQFQIGKAITVRDGTDLTFIATGEPTSRALAAEILITVEEHSVCGGLGECCAGILQQGGIHTPLNTPHRQKWF